jgi:arylsulfatase A-like enzyme
MLTPIVVFGSGFLSMPQVKETPNVVFIMADDIGYGDLGCYGAKDIKTPNIDRLPKAGVRFTDAHSTATVCTPTRYSLLSGEYSFRNRGGAGILNSDAPLAFRPSQSTWPKMMQKAGYRTAVVGKWHMGLGESMPDYNKPIAVGPNTVGFDESFIIPSTGDRVPSVFVQNGRVVNFDPSDPIQYSFSKRVGNERTGEDSIEGLKLKPVQGHLGTVVNGVSRIGFMSGGQKARWIDEDIADILTTRAVDFIKSNHKRPFFLYFATNDAHAPLLPHQRFVGKSKAGIRGDAVQEFDWSVGQVMKALADAKLTKNTIVVVSSDNGAAKADGYEDPREKPYSHLPNGTLRGQKYDLYEGGHRVPMIVSWPAKTPKGKTSNALVAQIDFYASISKLLGIELQPTEGPDSLEMMQTLFYGATTSRPMLVHHKGGFGSDLALREGSYVLIERKAKSELFDLATDPEQKNDLAPSMPERVRDMKTKLDLLRQQPTRR